MNLLESIREGSYYNGELAWSNYLPCDYVSYSFDINQVFKDKVMPCYLRGRVIVTDEELLIKEASKVGMVLNTERARELVRLSREGKINTKEIMRNYSISKVKLAAQKKGWKSSVKQEGDKIVITLRE